MPVALRSRAFARVLVLGLIVTALFAASLRAEVARVEVGRRADVAFPGYEQISGRIYFAVDPANPRNAVIADIGSAPRNAQGRVEFSADFVVLRPKSGGNGVAILHVPNRGRARALPIFNRARAGAEYGDGFLMRRGFTVVLVGWQHDVPEGADVLKIQVPGTPPVAGLLVADRLMLSEDVDAVVQRAGQHWDVVSGVSAASR
jgi:hypothetical protein